MPELPELLVLQKQLKRLLVGYKYRRTHTTVTDIVVRGKQLIICTAPYYIYIHLKLTGHLCLQRMSNTRKTLTFIYYSDTINIYVNDNMNLATVRQTMDPPGTAYNISSSMYLDLCQVPNKQIHNALRTIPGIGNYLVSEICGLSRIYPLTLVKNVNVRKIVNVAKTLIPKITKLGGSIYYTDLYGKPGKYIPHYYKNTDLNVIRHGKQKMYTSMRK